MVVVSSWSCQPFYILSPLSIVVTEMGNPNNTNVLCSGQFNEEIRQIYIIQDKYYLNENQ